MLSSVKQPKSKADLARAISKLPSTAKFTAIEASAIQDKVLITKTVEKYLRKGGFSVIFIEGAQ